MPRDIKDHEGTAWNCVQAYAGLETNENKEPEIRAQNMNGTVRVVCTPSGGAQSVALQLPVAWEDEYSDEELLSQIKQNTRER